MSCYYLQGFITTFTYQLIISYTFTTTYYYFISSNPFISYILFLSIPFTIPPYSTNPSISTSQSYTHSSTYSSHLSPSHVTISLYNVYYFISHFSSITLSIINIFVNLIGLFVIHIKKVWLIVDCFIIISLCNRFIFQVVG